MTISLAENIDDAQQDVTLSEAFEASPGDLFRLGDECVQFGGHQLRQHGRQFVTLLRGLAGTTAAAHTAGTALLGVADAKVSGSDETVPGPFSAAPGGGAVDSVNSQTGVVVLDAGDVGADATGAAAAAQTAAIAAASTDATTKAGAAQTAAIAAAATDATTKANASQAAAIASAATDATTKANAAQAASQPVDSDLTAIAALTTTAYGRALLELADAAAGRTAFGLGTASTQASGAFDAAGAAAAAAAASQPVDSDLTAIAALTTTSYGRSLLTLADAAAGRAALGLDTAVIEFVIDGGGSAIATGVKGYIEVPFACAIAAVRLLADVSGSIVVDIWKDTYANYPPVVGDSITASAKPTISSATKSQDSTLTGWTKAIAAGDILGFNVDSAATVTRVTVSLTVTR